MQVRPGLRSGPATSDMMMEKVDTPQVSTALGQG
jgi:hypothetical protein